MQVILMERVEKLGAIGDVVTVKDGYARNFLIPRKKALRANEDNKKLFDIRKAEIEKQNEARRQDAEKLSQKVEGIAVTLIRQASEDGRLFGSVSGRDIAKAVSEQQEGVSHTMIQLNLAIKTVGVYPVAVALHPEVKATVKVVVARSESEAKEALKSGITGGLKTKSEAELIAEEEALEKALAEQVSAPEADETDAA